MLREADRRLGLTRALPEVIPDPREPLLVVHEQRTMLAQRILGIALGYEDLNNHQTLRDDPLLQTLTEKTPDPEEPLASPATRCRLENRVGRKALAEMAIPRKLFATILDRIQRFGVPPPLMQRG